jgi:hypothetical protein
MMTSSCRMMKTLRSNYVESPKELPLMYIKIPEIHLTA